MSNSKKEVVTSMEYKVLGCGYYNLDFQDSSISISKETPFLAGLSPLDFSSKGYTAQIKVWDKAINTTLPCNTNNQDLLRLCEWVDKTVDSLGTGYSKETLDTVKADACFILTKAVTERTIALLKSEFIYSKNHYISIIPNLEDLSDAEYGQLQVGLFKNKQCLKKSLSSIELRDHLNEHRDTLVNINFDTDYVEAVIDRGCAVGREIPYVSLDKNDTEVESKGYEIVTRAERIRQKLNLLDEIMVFDDRGLLLVDVREYGFNQDVLKKYDIPN